MIFEESPTLVEFWNTFFLGQFHFPTKSLLHRVKIVPNFFPQVGGLLGMFLGVSLLNFFDAGSSAIGLLRTKIRKKKEETILAVNS